MCRATAVSARQPPNQAQMCSTMVKIAREVKLEHLRQSAVTPAGAILDYAGIAPRLAGICATGRASRRPATPRCSPLRRQRFQPQRARPARQDDGRQGQHGRHGGGAPEHTARRAQRRAVDPRPRRAIGEADHGSTGVAPHPAGVDPGHSHGPPTTTNFVNAYGGTNFLTVANPGSIGST